MKWTLAHGASACSRNLTQRLENKLSSIQRPILLNITDAYRTTSTAALKVIEGLMPLHLKIKLESEYVSCQYRSAATEHRRRRKDISAADGRHRFLHLGRAEGTPPLLVSKDLGRKLSVPGRDDSHLRSSQTCGDPTK
ncbi:hypothetical protein AVEN_126583-1 [Araneus ventricosus]|uniref:Uncharacterized protein n=1 Tax=Araneus ventricosus TaxID=182803 RepID=A0A4Y2IAS7_ARAVE|nr:hypothetical protein AVEN_126583-1 [Araneus ventricosus]